MTMLTIRPMHAILQILYNIGLVLEESALEVFKRANKGLTKTVDETRRGEQDISTAIDLYTRPDVAQAFTKSKE